MEPTEARPILAAITDIFFYAKLRDALKPAGYLLERVKTAQELLDRTRQSQPCAVVLNLNDDQVGGLRTLGQLRQERGPDELPVLAFANHDDVHTWNAARSLGVSKIVSRNEFSRRTRELIDELLAARRETSA